MTGVAAPPPSRGQEVEPPRSGGLYGTVLVLAVVIALSKGGKTETSLILGGIVITSLVFFIVHVYADTLTSRVRYPERSWLELARHHANHEAPILEAPVGPGIPLALGWAGILSREAATWAAIGMGMVGLFVWGLVLGRALGYRPGGCALIGLLNVGLGAAMVGLKVLVH